MTVFPRAANAAHRQPERAAGLDVHSDRRLVEDQHRRVRDEREPEPHALGLTARQLLGPPAGDLREAGELERLVDLEWVGMERGHQSDQLAHGDVADQRARLEHRADLPGGDGVSRRAAEQRHGAAVRADQPEHHVDRRRLPGAVWPEERDGLAPVDRHINAADGVDHGAGGAVGLGGAAELDADRLLCLHATTMPRLRRDRIGAVASLTAGQAATGSPRSTEASSARDEMPSFAKTLRRW